MLCWHLWVQALKNMRPKDPEALLFSISPAKLSRLLQVVLEAVGMPPDQVGRYTTHSMKRGAGSDVLKSEGHTCHLLGGPRWHTSNAFGLPGMLQMGQWSTKQSAAHYATADEQEAASIAFRILQDSGDEE